MLHLTRISSELEQQRTKAVVQERADSDIQSSTHHADEQLYEQVKDALRTVLRTDISKSIDEEGSTGCRPIYEQFDTLLNEDSCGTTSHDVTPDSISHEQSISEFLTCIYQQIDSILNRCLTQSNSRSNTPVSVARQTPPVYGGKSTTTTRPSAEHVNGQSQRPDGRKADQLCFPSGRKAPRRVQLFATSTNAESLIVSPQCPQLVTPQAIKPKDSPVRTDFTPLSSSTPSNAAYNTGSYIDHDSHTERSKHVSHGNHSKPDNRMNHNSYFEHGNHSNQTNQDRHMSRGGGHASHSNRMNHSNHSITLADFVTPDRRKNKRNVRKQTPKSFNSPCGSWASGVGEGDITPLEGQAALSCVSTSLTSHDKSAEGITSVTSSAKLGNSQGTEIDAPRPANISLTSTPPSTTKTSNVVANKPSRRITPTVVSSDSNWHEFKQQAVFTPHSPKKAQYRPVPGSYDNERQQLREKKAQLMTPIVESDCTSLSTQSVNLQATPSKPSPRAVSEQCVEPQPGLVTLVENLDKAAAIFANLITAGKTHNVTADLHLLVQVLCCQIPDVSTNGDRRSQCGPDSYLLHSAHNGVYFAVEVMHKCTVLQNVLDPSVTRLLSENERVLRFNPPFAQLLRLRRTDNPQHNVNQSTFSSVSFQADTDNANNFPSEKHFIIFKKQRDLFYEVKREWDTNHAVGGWSFKARCSEKIFQLLNNGGVDVSNYVHLARLFVSQLIISCLKGMDEGWTEADEESMSLLSDLKQSQPEKYRKLRERFVMPRLSSVLLNRESTFRGQESFFKLFIEVAKDATFAQHLKDTLTLRLLTLNQTEFEGLNDPDCDISAAVDVFSDCLLTARLVAKFLGYLNFLPYLCYGKITPVLDEQYQLLRAAIAPPLDVRQLIDQAAREGRCRVLIPWLAQYLSHIDPYSMFLPYYKGVLGVLYKYFCHLKGLLDHTQGIEDIMLQYVSLSWLFNLSQFEDLEAKSDCGLEVKSSVTDSSLVSIKLVYDFSEILRCVKNLLIEFVMGMKSKVSVSRKITPLTAVAGHDQVVTSQVTTPATNLQQTLEDNFFQNQPPSLKKSVGFIAERVSSSYIKEFRAADLAKGLTESKLFIYNQAKEFDVHIGLKSRMAHIVNSRARALLSNLHEQAVNGINEYFEARVRTILELLLPSDTESYIIGICRAVILRQGVDRVAKWLKTNLTLQYISAELNQEVVKYCRTSGKSSAPNVVVEMFAQLGFDHLDTAPSPTDTLQQLQMFTGNVLSNPTQTISDEELEAIISQTVSCITGRSDIVLIALKSMCHLLIILLVAVATHQVGKITPKIIDCYNTLFYIEGMQCCWEELSKAIPIVEGWGEESNTLQERLLSYVLSQKDLLTVRTVK